WRPWPWLFLRLFRLGLAAAADDLADLAPAPGRDLARRLDMLERVEGRLDHVVRVRGAHRLRHDVVNAEALEDRAHRAASDDAGAWRCRAHDDLAGAEAALLVVVERAALAQRDADHVPLGLIGGFADGLGHLARLAGAVPDLALLVADDDDR